MKSNIRKIIKVLFIILLSLTLFSCKSETDYEKGLKEFENYNYEEAARYFESALTKDNYVNKEDIALILSKTYLNLGKYIEAMDILDKTDGQKINEFVDELVKGYNLINEEGVNYKTVKIRRRPYLKSGTNLNGYHIDSTLLQGRQPIHNHYRDFMVLEIDNINDKHKFFTHNPDKAELSDSFDGAMFLGVSIDYQNGELDSFTISEGRFDFGLISNIYRRTYDSNFVIQRYTEEEYYSVDTHNHNIIEEEFFYHDNGALEKYIFSNKQFISTKEWLDIYDNYLYGRELTSGINIDEIKKRQGYVSEFTKVSTYADDGRFLKEGFYKSGSLKLERVATYDENNRVISYVNNNFDGYSEGYNQPFKWSFEYNDDGYLIKEISKEGDYTYFPTGFYRSYEYSEDYAIVVVEEHYPSESDFETEYTLYRHPDGNYHGEPYVLNE